MNLWKAFCIKRLCLGEARSDAPGPGSNCVPLRKTSPWIVVTLGIGLALAISAPASKAQAPGIAGKYQCAQVKVHGKAKPCSSAHLTLRSDGHFELRGWEGDYTVTGNYVELSDKLVKSKAKLEPGYKLVFRYQGRDGVVEVTYERRQSAPGNDSLS